MFYPLNDTVGLKLALPSLEIPHPDFEILIVSFSNEIKLREDNLQRIQSVSGEILFRFQSNISSYNVWHAGGTLRLEFERYSTQLCLKEYYTKYGSAKNEILLSLPEFEELLAHLYLMEQHVSQYARGRCIATHANQLEAVSCPFCN